MKFDEKGSKRKNRSEWKKTMQTNIKCEGQCSLKGEGYLSMNSMQETAQITDAKKAEKK